MKLLLASALLAVTLTGATPDFRVYVSVENGPVAVSRINPQTGQGLAAFTVPYGAQNMALTPDGRQAYVLTPSNAYGAKNIASAVSVYDLHSGTLLRTIPLTSSPWQLYFSPDGITAYVVAADGNAPPENETFTLHLFAIETATGAVTTDTPYPALSGFASVQQDAISPDGKLLYVASGTAGSAEVAIFSLPSLTPAGSFEVNNVQSVNISGMAITPNGEYLVLAAGNSPGLLVYSTATKAIVGQAALPSAYGVAISSDSRSAFTLGSVTEFGFFDLLKLDLSTFQVTDSGVKVEGPSNLIVSPNGSILLAGSTFFDPATLSVIVPNVNILSFTAYGGFTPNDRTLWVLNAGSSELVVIDPATNEAVGTIAIPGSLGISPGEGKSLLISSLRLAIVSTEIGQVVRSASVDEESAAAIVQAGGNAYISTGQQLFSYNLQTLDFSELALPPPLNYEADIVNAIAASPDGQQFYADYYTVGGIGPDAEHYRSDNSDPPCNLEGLLAYDTSTNAQIWCIGLDSNGAIAISPDSSTAYVDTGFSITTVDLNAQKIRAYTHFPDDPEFGNFAISPDGATLYGKDGSTGTVAAIDVATMTVTQRFTIPQGSNGLVITPDASTLYLPNSAYPQVTAINTATGQTTAIPLFSVSSGGIAVAPI